MRRARMELVSEGKGIFARIVARGEVRGATTARGGVEARGARGVREKSWRRDEERGRVR